MAKIKIPDDPIIKKDSSNEQELVRKPNNVDDKKVKTNGLVKSLTSERLVYETADLYRQSLEKQ